MGAILDTARALLAATTRQAALVDLQDGYLARETKRIRREARRHGLQLHCGGCHRYVTATNHRCACGFHNDIRGRRNHGGWA